MSKLIAWFLTVLRVIIFSSDDVSGAIFNDVQWTTAIKLSEYVSYKSVTIFTFKVPENTYQTVMSFQGHTSGQSCSFHEVHVYFQHGSYPVINPYNETFPDKFHTNRSSLHQLIIKNNDGPSIFFLDTPHPGTWYVAAFIPKKTGDSKISLPSMKGSCMYGMFVVVESQGFDIVEEMAFGQRQNISLVSSKARRESLFRFSVPVGTVAYSIMVTGCSIHYSDNSTVTVQKCPVTLALQEETLPSQNSSSVSCNKTENCNFEVFSPILKKWTYLRVALDHVENVTNISFILDFTSNNCMVYQLVYLPTFDFQSSLSDPIHNITHDSCIMISDLGRFALSEFDYNISFVMADSSLLPKPLPVNSLLVPDYTTIVTRFRVDDVEDIGGTLKIALASTDPSVLNKNQTAVVYLCLMRYRIPGSANAMRCKGGILLQMNITSLSVEYSYIPYPEPGEWYLGLYSQCFDKHTGKVSNCVHFPRAAFSVELSSCVDSQCGEFGMCKEYISGVHVFSTCSCIAGWRGYGCTDGTEAVAYSTELTAVLLLTLSNLFFIPGIIVAVYRRFFIEAIVYTFNMFFSTFYHACDTSDWLQYCMMPYDLLSFSDYLGSILSFWVTLIAMAEIGFRLRAVCHIVGVLGIAVAVEYQRHGIWSFVIPAGLGLVIMVVSWIRQCKLTHQIFPTKRRYLTNLLPGIILAGTGLIIFAFFETDENYKYTHSAWHVVISSSIVFLLPQRRDNKGNSCMTSTRQYALENYANGDVINDTTNSGDSANVNNLDNPAYISES